MLIRKLDKKTLLKLTRAGALATQIPFSLALCAVVGCLMGVYFDRFFGTAPWGLIFFLCCGLAAGGKAVMRIVKELNDLLDDKK